MGKNIHTCIYMYMYMYINHELYHIKYIYIKHMNIYTHIFFLRCPQLLGVSHSAKNGAALSYAVLTVTSCLIEMRSLRLAQRLTETPENKFTKSQYNLRDQ